ncbi:hypothetical protein P168DRAFT_344953 [Aspergillus campestris IBT 28561]|uniref:Uncharacterized protein n=1 Tax=Aspergillus campestris (strain IBT 28561) TaxID=1392248 RepID=A0A2I1D1M8_ASPC2|nr:uncharacterized protein P168DRAFT_344953 [Aspergillus campestris IBT 28561]PKY03782.1 hypothetical protein P168DRAFT_344953 [Aspergillus campestris IBT 28561]
MCDSKDCKSSGTPSTDGGSTDKGFTYTGSGVNDKGNHYCSRDYGPSSGSNGEEGKPGYHYSNSDGSYYYSNPNGSKYYNDGKGYDRYTAPDGQTFERHETQDQGSGETNESRVTAGVEITEEGADEATDGDDEEDSSDGTGSCASYDYDGEPFGGLEEAIYSDEEGLEGGDDDDQYGESCGDFDDVPVEEIVFYY